MKLTSGYRYQYITLDKPGVAQCPWTVLLIYLIATITFIAFVLDENTLA